MFQSLVCANLCTCVIDITCSKLSEDSLFPRDTLICLEFSLHGLRKWTFDVRRHVFVEPRDAASTTHYGAVPVFRSIVKDLVNAVHLHPLSAATMAKQKYPCPSCQVVFPNRPLRRGHIIIMGHGWSCPSCTSSNFCDTDDLKQVSYSHLL